MAESISDHFAIAQRNKRDTFWLVFRTAKLLAGLLALLAVGQVQVFGWVNSYLCFCHPDSAPVATAVCRAEVCHPEQGHNDHQDRIESANPAGDPAHRHLELRDSHHETTIGSGSGKTPPPLWTLAWSHVDPICEVLRRSAALGWIPPPESPPTALLSTRSIVMLV